MIPKIGAADEFEGLLQTCGGMLSRLLVREMGMTKAASECFSKMAIEEHRPTMDKYALIHFIAMGAHERYGFNRNGDAFTRAELMEHHPTFVKHAHLFREHRNQDPKLAIGQIKASAYNGPMDRVELLVWLDRDKAEEEYEKAAAGKELSGSMACVIHHDVCSCCEKQSRTVRDYCDHAKNHMTQWLPEFRKYAFVYNPKPRFKDYSVVARPADRIAHYITYRFGSELQKAASDMVVTGSDWADFYGMGAPDEDTTRACAKLAAAWLELQDPAARLPLTHKAAFIRDMLPRAHPGQFTDGQVDDMRRLRPGTLWRQLAKRAAVLPFYSFVSYLTGTPVSKVRDDPMWKAARGSLDTLMPWLISDDGVKFAGMTGDQFEPCGECEAELDPEHDDAIDKLLSRADTEFSASEAPLKRRISFDCGEKEASVALPADNEALLFARAYLVYKAASAVAIDDLLGPNEARDLLIAHLD